MRLAVALAVIAVSAVAAPASAGEVIIGAGVGYGTKIEMPGLQLGGYYAFAGKLANLRVGGDIDGFMPNSDRGVGGEGKVTWFDVNLNAHYLIPGLPEDSPFSVYALGGLSLAIVHASFTYDEGVNQRDLSETEAKPGVNLGAGAEYDIKFAAAYFEGKYVISSADQLVVFLGLRFALPTGQ
ncbi:MAG: outer membrane protein [Myxococcota bacterium]